MFDENVLAEELQGKDALVSCLGGGWSWFNRKPVTIYTDSVKVFANAMRRSGVNRLVVMSSWHLEGKRIEIAYNSKYLTFQTKYPER